jgi:2,4-dienoyl-CoA reductase-like NADH-dependent reductase (Old Yellow Enzyme family)
MSGRSNIIHWLESKKIEATDELVAHLFEVAKSQPRNMEEEEIQNAVEKFLQQS